MQYTPYNLPLFITAALSAALCLYIWRRRSTPGAPALFALLLGVTVWTLAYALTLLHTDLQSQLFWSYIEYLGIVIVPATWFLFALQYTGRLARPTPRLLLLAIEPLVTMTMVTTNEHHYFYWSSVTPITVDGCILLTVTYGPGFWIHALYSYVLILTGTFALLQAIFKAPHLYRNQFGATLIAVTAPWVANALYIFGLNPFPNLDLTPFAFALTGLAMTWAISRYQLLELVPVAHNRIVENMNDAVLVLQEDDRVVEINPAARYILNRPDDTVIGQAASDLLPDLPGLSQLYGPQAEIDAEITLEVEAQVRVYDLHASPLRDRRERYTGRLLILHDITARRQTEIELRGLKDAAEAASQAKSEFLANVSHELRTPLNAVIGMTQLVLDDDLADQQRQYLTIAQESGHSLLQLIEDVLDFSRIETGHLDLDHHPFSLRHSIGAVLKGLALKAEEKKLQLISDIATHVPDALVGDESRLRQIAVNLVGNAIKFTEVGQVVVHASVKESHGKRIHLLLAVEDTGIGIPAAKHETIFDAFSQADGSTTRRYGGTGLGLAISRRLTNAMGGQIWLDSREGEGSTFFFELPFEVQETQPQTASDQQFEKLQSSDQPPTIDKQRPALQALLADETAQQDGFSLKAMLEQVEGDEVLLGELAVSILQNYPPYLDQVRAAVQSGDSDALQRNAHALKGIVGAVGINPAFSTALQLEEMGRGAQLSEALETLGDLEEKIDRLKAVLHPLLPASTD